VNQESRREEEKKNTKIEKAINPRYVVKILKVNNEAICLLRRLWMNTRERWRA